MPLNFLKRWMPVAMLAVGTMALPAVAQETSQEAEAKAKQEAKAEQKQSPSDKTGSATFAVQGQMVIADGEGNVRIFRPEQGENGTFVWRSEDGEIGGAVTGVFTGQGDASGILVGPAGKQEVLLRLMDQHGGQQQNQNVEVIVDENGDGNTFLMVSPVLDTDQVLLKIAAGVNEYMIGVSCEPATDALKAQLDIETGLVVNSVVEDAPADGVIETHDVLLQAGGSDLNGLEDLVEAVQEAGKGETELTITVLRKGRNVEVEVTPQKRKFDPQGILAQDIQNFDLDIAVPEIILKDGMTLRSLQPGVFEWSTEAPPQQKNVFRYELKSGPGGDVKIEEVKEVEVGGDELRAEIEQLRAQLEALSKQLEKRDR